MTRRSTYLSSHTCSDGDRKYSPNFCHRLGSGTYLSSPLNPTMTFPFKDFNWQKSVAKSSVVPDDADGELGSPTRINAFRSLAAMTRETLDNAGKTVYAPFRLLSWIAPQKLRGMRTKTYPVCVREYSVGLAPYLIWSHCTHHVENRRPDLYVSLSAKSTYWYWYHPCVR